MQMRRWWAVVGWAALWTSACVCWAAPVQAETTQAVLPSSSGGLHDLGTLGGDSSSATAINACGQVVGYADTAAGAQHAFRWTPSTGMQDLGTLGGSRSFARAVNAGGQVAGDADTPDGRRHAFRWTESSGMRDLGTLGGDSLAFGINPAGEVIGYSGTAAEEQHAFRWTPSTGMQDLGTLGGPSSAASAINASGVVVGSVQTSWFLRSQPQKRRHLRSPANDLLSPQATGSG
jgi:probable HAF family extracellular repeat protein